MELEDNKRRRRISEADDVALLAFASPHLRPIIIADNRHASPAASSLFVREVEEMLDGRAERHVRRMHDLPILDA